MPEETSRVFRFGVFEVDEASGELRKHGVRIKLHSQPLKVLLLLLEKPSVIVTREEMRGRLWGTETFVDFDHGLNSAVNKIREALGDSAAAPRYVETIPGKGYRFLTSVASQDHANVPSRQVTAAVSAAAPAEETQPRPGVTPVLLAPDSTGSSKTKDWLGATGLAAGSILTTCDELPVASRTVVCTLLLLIQAMYLGFYLGALANLGEIHEIFLEAGVENTSELMTLLIASAAALIPIRLFIVVAVALNFRDFPSKFRRLFPVLLILDVLWAVSPFLLIHHISSGLALGLSAPLVYMPFAQRSLVLMYSNGR